MYTQASDFQSKSNNMKIIVRTNFSVSLHGLKPAYQ